MLKSNGILKNKDNEFEIYNIECMVNVYGNIKNGSFITDKELYINDKFEKIEFKINKQNICIEHGEILDVVINEVEYLENETYKIYYNWNEYNII